MELGPATVADDPESGTVWAEGVLTVSLEITLKLVNEME
jgi:hypothetical protein